MQRRTPAASYNVGNSAEAWYDEQLPKSGTDWCIPFIDTVSEYTLYSDLVFVSPSANRAIFEKVMFNHISRKRQSTFICADLACIESHENAVVAQMGTFTYKECANALDIQSYIKSPCSVFMKKPKSHFPMLKSLNFTVRKPFNG